MGQNNKWRWSMGVCLSGLISLAWPAGADEGKKAADVVTPSAAIFEKITAQARPAVVVIHQAGRGGENAGVGSGFIINEEGLVVTNLHVIGEGRPVEVTLADGRKVPVAGIEAWDRKVDLAILRLDLKDQSQLPAPLTLQAVDEHTADGAPIIALGAPQGYEASVVQGVLSARREIPDFPGLSMIQMAMTIEPGNSGGPVLNENGHVIGIVTLKSTRSAQLGFALPLEPLRTLLAQPNPIPMSRWQTIGMLDATQWQVLDAQWTQRAGVIKAENSGAGFGGRALCLWKEAPKEETYEVSVQVRLDNEAGAAGLVFASDGAHRHYGFYPSGGKLRLTRFDGPDVFSWQIIKELSVSEYHPGEWNELRVRREGKKITASVNGSQVLSVEDDSLHGGQVGLAKFRQTVAEFKNFRTGTTLTPSAGEQNRDFFLRQARALEQNANALRLLAERMHQREIEQALTRTLRRDPDLPTDVIYAALLLAKLDNPELDVIAYRQRITRLAQDFAESLAATPSLTPAEKIKRLNDFFFQEKGFHGARFDFENQANSYLNEVLDDREGLPITLCLLYMEIGQRAGLPLEGVPRPGQFVVRLPALDGAPARLINVYDGGRDLEEPESLAMPKATPRQIIVRMLHNLRTFALEKENFMAARRYADVIVALEPENVPERISRAVLAYQLEDWETAQNDLGWLSEQELNQRQRENLQQLRRTVEAKLSRQ